MLLKIDKLDKHFGGLHAVNNVSFGVKEGIIKGVIGPNGAGKTTLFNLISGSTMPDSGDVLFNNKSIFGLPPYLITGSGISRTFQNIKLFTNMSVIENVMVGAHITGKAGFFKAMLNLPSTWKEEENIRNKAIELLKFLDIEDLAEANSSDLSFGDQRAVEFARALASNPTLLLLDEPAAGLNMQETDKLAEQIQKINKNGITILLVEHDMSLVMNICDEIAVLNYGAKIADDTPKEIQKKEEVIKIYLGEDDD